jgi:hypothetical protein
MNFLPFAKKGNHECPGIHPFHENEGNLPVPKVTWSPLFESPVRPSPVPLCLVIDPGFGSWGFFDVVPPRVFQESMDITVQSGIVTIQRWRKKRSFITRTAKKSEYRGILQASSSSNGVNILKHIKPGVIILLLFGMVIALTCITNADQVVPAVPETQTLGTVTTADVVGLVTETDAGTWSLTSGGIPVNWTDPIVAQWPGWNNGGLFGFDYDFFVNHWLANYPPYDARHVQDFLNYYIAYPDARPISQTDLAQMKSLLSYLENQGGLHDPPLYDQEVHYTTAYDASIVAQAGHTSFVKSTNIDTRNKVIGQSNINAQTELTYIATSDGGNVVGSENLLLDGVGMPTKVSDRMLCPFAAIPADVIPAYCNIVQAGSKYDLTIGSVTTSANDRFVGTDATNPAALDYVINLKPYGTSQGQILASGSAMTYVNAHVQEARNMSTQNIPTFYPGYPDMWITVPPTKTEDLTYSETSSAQGTITAFTKVIAYQSGKALL